MYAHTRIAAYTAVIHVSMCLWSVCMRKICLYSSSLWYLWVVCFYLTKSNRLLCTQLLNCLVCGALLLLLLVPFLYECCLQLPITFSTTFYPSHAHIQLLNLYACFLPSYYYYSDQFENVRPALTATDKTPKWLRENWKYSVLI